MECRFQVYNSQYETWYTSLLSLWQHCSSWSRPSFTTEQTQATEFPAPDENFVFTRLKHDDRIDIANQARASKSRKGACSPIWTWFDQGSAECLLRDYGAKAVLARVCISCQSVSQSFASFANSLSFCLFPARIFPLSPREVDFFFVLANFSFIHALPSAVVTITISIMDVFFKASRYR